MQAHLLAVKLAKKGASFSHDQRVGMGRKWRCCWTTQDLRTPAPEDYPNNAAAQHAFGFFPVSPASGP